MPNSFLKVEVFVYESYKKRIPPDRQGDEPHNNRLMWLRNRKSLTQQELASKSGVNIRQIQRYESGTSGCENMTLKNAISIADVLGCDVRDLLEK